MNQKLQIQFDKVAFESICHKYQITKFAFFGSVMRDDFTPESDIDIMVEFAHDKTPGIKIVKMLEEFSKVFGGHQVDFMTFRQLKSGTRLAKFIQEDLEIYYEQKAA